jgi:hypothetical protein
MRIVPCFKWKSVSLIDNENIVEITESLETKERSPEVYFVRLRGSNRTIDLKNPKAIILLKMKKA